MDDPTVFRRKASLEEDIGYLKGYISGMPTKWDVLIIVLFVEALGRIADAIWR